MKYCFVIPFQCVSPKGGVKVQAEMWKVGLEKLGHSVTMAGSWDTPEWSSFDAIIIFGYAPGVAFLAESLAKENPHLVMAPIIDPPWTRFIYKFFVKYWGAKNFSGFRRNSMICGCRESFLVFGLCEAKKNAVW